MYDLVFFYTECNFIIYLYSNTYLKDGSSRPILNTYSTNPNIEPATQKNQSHLYNLLSVVKQVTILHRHPQRANLPSFIKRG